MMMEFTKTFGGQLIVLALIYTLVLILIFLDLWAGIRKARQRGEFRTSYGLRKTVEKTAGYFNMLLVLTVIDAMQMLAVHHLNPQISFRIPLFPILTVAGAIFVGVIEFKSIYEKAADKDKGRYQQAAKTLYKALSDKNTADTVSRIFEYLKTNGEDETKG